MPIPQRNPVDDTRPAFWAGRKVTETVPQAVRFHACDYSIRFLRGDPRGQQGNPDDKSM